MDLGIASDLFMSFCSTMLFRTLKSDGTLTEFVKIDGCPPGVPNDLYHLPQINGELQARNDSFFFVAQQV